MTTSLAHVEFPRPIEPRRPTLVRSGFLGALTAAEQAQLRLIGGVVRVAAGALMMLQGEPAERLMILTAGHAKLARIRPGGHEALLAIRDPGDLIGHEAIEAGRVDVNVIAVDPVEALVISQAAFRAQLDRSPGLLRAVLGAVVDQYVEISHRHARQLSMDTSGRLADCLIELADRYGRPEDHEVVITLPIRNGDLSAWIGASRAGTAKALQTFRQLGWIRTDGGRIGILDGAALRGRAAV